MKTILIIDDDTMLRNNLRMILELEGFTAFEADNGLVGLAYAKELQPDLIICDVMMPALDGYAVLTQLQQHPRTSAIPLIFLTAISDDGHAQRALSMGAEGYLTKPYVLENLLATIRSALYH